MGIPFARRGAFLAIALFVSAHPVSAQHPGFDVRTAFSQIGFPTTIRFTPEGRLFVTELTGRVSFYPSASTPNPVLWATVPVGLTGEDGVDGLEIRPR